VSKKHNDRRGSEYRTWVAMKARCLDPEHERWKRYGGRGITVCERWRNSYGNFLADMGRKPSRRHQIHRINNDGPYEPGNCRWVTPLEHRRLSVEHQRRGPWIITRHFVRIAQPKRNGAGKLVRAEYRDAGCPGLYLVVQPSGTRSWALRFRRRSKNHRSKNCKKTLGRAGVGGLSLTAARAAAAAHRRQFKHGRSR